MTSFEHFYCQTGRYINDFRCVLILWVSEHNAGYLEVLGRQLQIMNLIIISQLNGSCRHPKHADLGPAGGNVVVQAFG